MWLLFAVVAGRSSQNLLHSVVLCDPCLVCCALEVLVWLLYAVVAGRSSHDLYTVSWVLPSVTT